MFLQPPRRWSAERRLGYTPPPGIHIHGLCGNIGGCGIVARRFDQVLIHPLNGAAPRVYDGPLPAEALEW